MIYEICFFGNFFMFFNWYLCFLPFPVRVKILSIQIIYTRIGKEIKNKIVDRCLQYMNYYSEGFNLIILNKNNIDITDNFLSNIDGPTIVPILFVFLIWKSMVAFGCASIIVLRPIYEWLSDMHTKYNIKKDDKDILIGFGCPFDTSILENWFLLLTALFIS